MTEQKTPTTIHIEKIFKVICRIPKPGVPKDDLRNKYFIDIYYDNNEYHTFIYNNVDNFEALIINLKSDMNNLKGYISYSYTYEIHILNSINIFKFIERTPNPGAPATSALSKYRIEYYYDNREYHTIPFDNQEEAENYAKMTTEQLDQSCCGSGDNTCCEQLQKQIDVLEKVNSEQSVQIRELQDCCENANSNIETLQEQVTILQQCCEQQTAVNSEQQAQIAQMSDEITTLQEQVAILLSGPA
jgi:hypothetical protein